MTTLEIFELPNYVKTIAGLPLAIFMLFSSPCCTGNILDSLFASGISQLTHWLYKTRRRGMAC